MHPISRKSIFITISVIFIATGLLVAKFLFSFSHESGRGKQTEAPKSFTDLKTPRNTVWTTGTDEEELHVLQVRQREQLTLKITEINRKYHSNNAELMQQFEKEVQASISGPMSQARAAIPQVVQETTGEFFLKTLAKAVATNQLETQIEKAMNRELLPYLTIAYGSSLNARENLRRKMKENQNQFLSELALAGQATEDEPVNHDLLYQFVRDTHTQSIIEKQARQLDFSIAVNLLLPGIMWRSTLKEIFSIHKLARKAATMFGKKLAKRGVLAGILTVVDGPLPIGDIIGGLWLSYGIYDVGSGLYKLKLQVPRDVERNLNQAIDRYEQSLLTTLVNQSHEDLRQWSDFQGKINDQLALELGQE